MPTVEVMLSPVSPTVIDVGAIAPTAEVEDNPVKGTPISDTKDPTEDVAVSYTHLTLPTNREV